MKRRISAGASSSERLVECFHSPSVRRILYTLGLTKGGLCHSTTFFKKEKRSLKKGIFDEINIKIFQTESKIPLFHLLLRTLHTEWLIMQSSQKYLFSTQRLKFIQ